MTRVYCFDLGTLPPAAYDRLLETATPSRRQRAEGCLRREDALRLLAAEALLRYALPDVDLTRLETAPGGKPRLPGVCFNLSHSGAWVALAVGDKPVGIDVECHKPGHDREKLARRYFTPEEQTWTEGSEHRFLQVWTKKESYLKYTGEGLTRPLQGFSVFGSDLPPMHTWALPGAVMTLCADELTDTWELVKEI